LFLSAFLLIYLKIQGVKWRQLLAFLSIPIAFAFVGILSIILVLNAEATTDTIFVLSKKHIPLSITWASLRHGEVVLWRAFNSLLSLYILIALFSPQEKSILLAKLRVPQPLVELGVLSFRYIQLLGKKKQEILIAQRLRLGYTTYPKSFRSTVLLLSTVFIYSISAFRMNHQALLTRGYTGTLHYATTTDYRKDRIWVVGLIIGVLAVVLIGYCVCYI
nr:hypothetical protein [Flavobacteriaceae bacterium]